MRKSALRRRKEYFTSGRHLLWKLREDREGDAKGEFMGLEWTLRTLLSRLLHFFQRRGGVVGSSSFLVVVFPLMV